MNYLIDTNILLDYPQIIEDKKNDLFITTSVLQELDGLKRNLNKDTAFNARRAAIFISRNIDNIHWINTDDYSEAVDDQLLHIAEKENHILMTNDVYLKVKAKINNVETSGYSPKDNYGGVQYWYISTDDNLYNEELDKLYQTGEIPQSCELYENQYLIVKDVNNSVVNKHGEQDFTVMGKFVCKGQKLYEVKEKRIVNQWINCIVPRNAEQACLFDALLNPDITILYAGGGAGKG